MRRIILRMVCLRQLAHPDPQQPDAAGQIDTLQSLPGVMADAMRILIKSGVVLVAGEKERHEPFRGPASFHLVERDFGRFARAVRIHAAIDAANARARLRDGELRISLPKIPERRGREILVAVESDSGDRSSPA